MVVNTYFSGTSLQSGPGGYTISLQIVVVPPTGTSASRTFYSQRVATELDTLYKIAQQGEAEFANVPNQLQAFTVIPNEFIVDGAFIKFAMNSTIRLDYRTEWPTFVSSFAADIATAS
jgi:hypothetical protein